MGLAGKWKKRLHLLPHLGISRVAVHREERGRRVVRGTEGRKEGGREGGEGERERDKVRRLVIGIVVVVVIVVVPVVVLVIVVALILVVVVVIYESGGGTYSGRTVPVPFRLGESTRRVFGSLFL